MSGAPLYFLKKLWISIIEKFASRSPYRQRGSWKRLDVVKVDLAIVCYDLNSLNS